MKRFLFVTLGVLLISALTVLAQPAGQQPITVSVTITAADAVALKEGLLLQSGGGIGRAGDYIGDIVDGALVVTDANVKTWVQKQVKQALEQVTRQQVENALRSSQNDLSALTPAERAEVLALIKKLKK